MSDDPTKDEDTSMTEDSVDQAPDWEHDAPSCRGCERSFTFRRRRHHCRACGRTFCGTCSKSKDTLPPQYKCEGPQRTCDSCHRNIKRLAILENPDDHPPAPDPVAVKTELLEKVRGLVATPEDQWLPKTRKNGISIDVLKIPDSSLFCVRSQFEVNAPLEKVVAIYANQELWKKWQPEMIKCNILESLSPNEEYVYVLYKVPVIDKREVVVHSTWCEGSMEAPDNADERCLLSASVSHPLVGKTKGVVRAFISFGYTRFYASEDGKGTRVLSAYHTDPRGLIPPAIVNATIGKVTDQLNDMRKFMEGHKYDLPEVMRGAGNPVLKISEPSS